MCKTKMDNSDCADIGRCRWKRIEYCLKANSDKLNRYAISPKATMRKQETRVTANKQTKDIKQSTHTQLTQRRKKKRTNHRQNK